MIVLLLFALVPALGLLGLYRWADGSIDDSEPTPPPPTTVVAPPPFDPPLATPIFALRRFPAELSRRLNVDEFRQVLAPFLGRINQRSCVAVSVDGVDIGAQNAANSVIPASNQKLVVGAVALDVLGEDDRFVTVVAADSEPSAGVVAGDLYLVGGGDPLLSSDWYPTSNLERYPVTSHTSLDTLADRVQASGVTAVEGDVVGVGDRYDDEFFAPGWGVGVAGLDAGPYDALLVNDSRVLGRDVRFDDPNVGGAVEFARLLEERGIRVGGGPVAGSVAVAEPFEIASIDSAPMSDVVSEMLGNSDNNTAEMLVKEIGLRAGGGGTREAGLAVMEATLAGWGIDTSGLVLSDGSGLSLGNRLTCGALLDVLQRGGPDTPLGAGLAVAGTSGTLADIFTDHELAGVLLGKTGTLNNPPFNADPPAVKALSGYVPVDGGGSVEYTLILNGPTISDQSEYRPIWNAFADVLATYPAGAAPAELGPR